jgi:hypothetical protein
MLAPHAVAPITRSELACQIKESAMALDADPTELHRTVDLAARLLNLDHVNRELQRTQGRSIEFRHIIGQPPRLGRPPKVRSIKVSNLSRDVSTLLEHGGTSVLGVAGATVNPVLLVIAVLLAIKGLRKAASVELTEKEACVFWGVIQASKRGYVAESAAIIRHTNEEMERYQLAPLSEAQIHNSPSRLAELKVIASIPNEAGQWRIIEGFTIRG